MTAQKKVDVISVRGVALEAAVLGRKRHSAIQCENGSAIERAMEDEKIFPGARAA